MYVVYMWYSCIIYMHSAVELYRSVIYVVESIIACPLYINISVFVHAKGVE